MNNLETRLWQAVEQRDSGADGRFYYAVMSTGVYCRPSCGSRKPKRENVLFFVRRDAAEQAGFRPCRRCRPDSSAPDVTAPALLADACRMLEGEAPALEELGRRLGYSPFHVQRVFRRALGVTPKGYADFCRVQRLKRELRAGGEVTQAMHQAGYGSSSRLYEQTSAQLGMTPSVYRRGAPGQTLRYGFVATPLGRLLVATTERGVCSIEFAATPARLRQEFPGATLVADDTWLEPWREALARLTPPVALPLDIRATAFQRRVWEYLQTIPRGETRSYRAVARALGQPTAARAVARACATNPVALAVPCHRVVREDGSPGGYRWGLARKKKLLAGERVGRLKADR